MMVLSDAAVRSQRRKQRPGDGGADCGGTTQNARFLQAVCALRVVRVLCAPGRRACVSRE